MVAGVALVSRRSTSSWALGRRCEGPTWMGWARRVREEARSVGDGWGNIVGTVFRGLPERREGWEGGVEEIRGVGTAGARRRAGCACMMGTYSGVCGVSMCGPRPRQVFQPGVHRCAMIFSLADVNPSGFLRTAYVARVCSQMNACCTRPNAARRRLRRLEHALVVPSTQASVAKPLQALQRLDDSAALPVGIKT